MDLPQRDAHRSWRACKPRIFGFANEALDHFLERNGYVGVIRGHMGKQCVWFRIWMLCGLFVSSFMFSLCLRSGVQIAKCGRVLTVFSTSDDHHQSRCMLRL